MRSSGEGVPLRALPRSVLLNRLVLMRLLRGVLPLFLLLALKPMPAVGQATALGGLRGVVTDTAGATVGDVRVSAVHRPTGFTATGVTDPEGRYFLPNLPAGGPYIVSAQALGYADRSMDGVHLQAGSVLRLDLELRTAAVALAPLEVHGRQDPRIDAARTGAATVVGREDVARHPTIERNVTELTKLAPMAVQTSDGFVIAGQNTRFNTFNIDNGLYQDLFGLSPDGVPGGLARARPLPLDAVEQFQVLVAPFDVRQSGFTGGLLNVVTRSGTNEWTGSAFGHYRDRNFIGALSADGTEGRPDHFRNALGGFTLGGPLARDRAHVLVAVELEQRTEPVSGLSLGRAPPLAIRVAPDSAARFAGILRDRFGIEPGSAGEVSLDNPRENVFARLDWMPGAGHRLMVRYNVAAARRDEGPWRAPVEAYEFGQQGSRRSSAAHGATVQLVSPLGQRVSNELLLNLQHQSDDVTPWSTDPVVEVDVLGSVDGQFVHRRLRAGGAYDAQSSTLRQRSAELRNSITAGLGSHTLTAGVSGELLGFRHRFVANPHGLYRFAGLDSLQANRPFYFERTLLAPAAGDGTVRFGVTQLAAFVQDEWAPVQALTLRFGLRVEVPRITDRPDHNPDLESALGVSTSTLPATALQVSPRFSFNWQRPGTYTTQVRGGAGIFAGRPAYAWLANAFAGTGTRSSIVTCSGARAPGLGNAATACLGAPQPADLRPSAITVFNRDFRYPQDLRLAAGVDQVLPLGFTASADLIYARSLRQVFVRDVNLADPVADKRPATGYDNGFGFTDRATFGAATPDMFRTLRTAGAFGQVLLLDERAENRSLAASIELERASQTVAVRAGYTYTRSVDTQSLLYQDAARNYGATATAGHPNEPIASISDFDRPHKLLFAVSSRALPRLGGTELSLVYTGQSGAPYSYVYGADINGDGYPGPGVAQLYNDLLYIPFSPGVDMPASLGSAIAFNRLIEAQDCLRGMRGGILARNSCRAPMTHRLDLRAAYQFTVGGAVLRLSGDLLNALSLVGSRHGRVYTVAPLVPLIQPYRVAEYPPSNIGSLEWWYGGATYRDSGGSVRSALPYTLDLAASRWQAQLGMEVRFQRRGPE
jgi:hypothetical protein